MRADLLLLYNTTQGDIKRHGSTLHHFTHHPCALGYGRRLGTITSNKGETRMKHATDIFPQALSELLALGEKQRRFIQDKEKAFDHSDRETVSPIRVKRKEKRARQALIQFN